MLRRFVAEPAGENTSVRFHCHAAGSPTPDIEWLKNKRPLDSRNVNYNKVKMKRWTLILQDLTESDKGFYTCVIANSHGSINATYELDVIPRKLDPPKLNAGFPQDKTVYVGSDVIMRCQVVVTRNDLVPHLQWVRQVTKEHFSIVDDPFETVKAEWPLHPELPCDLMVKRIFEKPPFECIELDFTEDENRLYGRERLVLFNVSVEDSGKYTCLAGNAIGIAYQSATLKVKKVPLAPLFTEELQRNISATVGEDVRVKCPVKGSPRPSIAWLKDGKPIMNNNQYLPTRQGLRILNAKHTDNGTYTCTVSNEHGQIQGNFTLTVYDRGQADKFEIIDPEPPSFTATEKMSPNISKTMGSSVRFRCNAHGSPTPDVKWLKNDEEIIAEKMISDQTRHKKGILALENIKQSDEGVYTCIVSNPYGQVNYTYRLQVQPPVILKPGFPKNKTVVIGSSVSFKCDVIATNLQPRIQWFKHIETDSNMDKDEVIQKIKDKWLNNPELTCDLIIGTVFPLSPPVVCIEQATVDGVDMPTDKEKLYLEDVSDDDSGMYTCLVVNGSHLSVHQSAWLQIVHGPTIPNTPEPTIPITQGVLSDTTMEPEMTQESPKTKREKEMSNFIIIGSVAGIVITLAVIIIVSCCICRRKRSGDKKFVKSNGVGEGKSMEEKQKEKTQQKQENIEMKYEKVSTMPDDEVQETNVDLANANKALKEDSSSDCKKEKVISSKTDERGRHHQDTDATPSEREADCAEEESVTSDSHSEQDPMNPDSASEHSAGSL
ncbi:fibroblast growth factor receptor-like isoform X2 [Ptychodera flava]